jgi:hypothetical protein
MTWVAAGSPTAPPSRWERSAEVLWRRTAKGVVVLPTDSSAAVTLEGLHAAVWEACGRPLSVDGLTDQLAGLLPDDPEHPGAAQRSAGEALRFLVAMGAIRESLHP